MFSRDPQKAEARRVAREAKRQERQEAAAQRQADKDALREWRAAHPAEAMMNLAATMRAWPTSKRGETSLGPIAGAHAEFVNAGAHKAWTATRLVGGVATGGASLVAGRKNKGAAVINLTFPTGAVQTYNVTPESGTLRAANQYVTAFNALSAQLATEASQE
ncbi:hypothetical protein ABTX35_01510 [Streptomyces sp. NPDC096080]|uniref:hypothetical protein n=1 Tax=Streptomyces sp. NPDC096080 TaxID=3156693 RepID=UPI00332A852A